MSIDRRQFLGVAVTGAVAVLMSTECVGDADDAYDVRTLARPDMLAVLGPDAVREIGRRYREAVPAEDDVAALHAAILAARPWAWHLASGSRTPVAALVGRDFAEGRVVVVNGWVLSATDARQCALFSLLAA
jgi:hypothetical protein